MTTMTIIDFAEVFLSYFFMTIALPALIFYPRFKQEPFGLRLIIYNLIGNGFMMATSYTLGLIYLLLYRLGFPVQGNGSLASWASLVTINRVILILFTLVVGFMAFFRIRKGSILAFASSFVRDTARISKGTLGWKSLLLHVAKKIIDALKRLFKYLWKLIKSNPYDSLLFLGFLFLMSWMFGHTLLKIYGNTTSDMLVHMSWVNSLNQNDLFAEGVYPFGFHVMVSYIVTVFGIETYLFFRVFAFIQTLYIYTSLLIFMRLSCKSRYIPYLAMGLLIIFPYYNVLVTQRFYSAIPEEYGMIFILPAAYYLLKFLRSRQRELSDGLMTAKLSRKEIKEAIAKGELSHKTILRRIKNALTLPSRGLLNIKNALGHFSFKKLTPKNIWQGLKKLRPMRFARFINDIYHRIGHMADKWTTSQWCLFWFSISFAICLNVHFYNAMVLAFFVFGIVVAFSFRIFKRDYLGDLFKAGLRGLFIAILPLGVALLFGSQLQYSLTWGIGLINGTVNENPGASGGAATGTTYTGIYDRVHSTYSNLQSYWIPEASSNLYKGILLSIFLLGIIGAGYILLKRLERCATYVALMVTLLLMVALSNGPAFFLPTLIQTYRLVIYFTYLFTILVAFILDGLTRLPVVLLKKGKTHTKERIFQYGTLGLVTLTTAIVIWTGWMGKPVDPDIMETNSSVMTTANILKDNQGADGTWTILSAFDEGVMVPQYGYHYETLTFLQEMNRHKSDGNIIIPTQYVYIYIEKVPLTYDYSLHYTGYGTKISTDEAAKSIDYLLNFSNYAVEKRLILMSKMYEWAQSYIKLYPNEMQVYYEDDQFVCYRVTQNSYRLLNFAIDYGYN